MWIKHWVLDLTLIEGGFIGFREASIAGGKAFSKPFVLSYQKMVEAMHQLHAFGTSSQIFTMKHRKVESKSELSTRPLDHLNTKEQVSQFPSETIK